MTACTHEDFAAEVEVTPIADGPEISDFMAKVKIRCAVCGEPFGFKGPPGGVSFYEPRCSVDALELNVPLMAPAELALAGPLPVLARGPMVVDVPRLAAPAVQDEGGER